MSKQEIKERAVEEHGVASYDLPKNKSLLIAVLYHADVVLNKDTREGRCYAL